jgi:hypothetical protein
MNEEKWMEIDRLREMDVEKWMERDGSMKRSGCREID